MKINGVWAVVLLSVTWVASAEVYLIDSPPFQSVWGEYTTDDQIFGTMVTSQAVQQNAGLVDILPILDSYDFTDGVQTFTENNSEPIAMSIEVNGQGELVGSYVAIWKTPITTQENGLVEGMDIYISTEQWQISGFKDGICGENLGPGGQCSSASFGGTNAGLYEYFDFIFGHGFDF